MTRTNAGTTVLEKKNSSLPVLSTLLRTKTLMELTLTMSIAMMQTASNLAVAHRGPAYIRCKGPEIFGHIDIQVESEVGCIAIV